MVDTVLEDGVDMARRLLAVHKIFIVDLSCALLNVNFKECCV